MAIACLSGQKGAASNTQHIRICMFSNLTHLNCGEGGDDGGRTEAVRDEAEVGEVPLDRRVQDLVGPRVAERGSVLVQQVHELLHNDPARQKGREGEGK